METTFYRIKAVEMLKLDKSHGVDGTVNAFYKTYRYLISDDFVVVIKEIFDKHLLCKSQYNCCFFFTNLNFNKQTSIPTPPYVVIYTTKSLLLCMY